MKHPETFGDLFGSHPDPWWGLRGDPFLWAELEEVLFDAPLPRTYSAFSLDLEAAFEKATGVPISASGQVHVDRFAHGGMSSGMVSLEFWQQKAFPLLVKRFSKRFETED